MHVLRPRVGLVALGLAKLLVLGVFGAPLGEPPGALGCVTLLLRREYLWGCVAIAAHVAGSIAMTIAGIVALRTLYAWSTP